MAKGPAEIAHGPIFIGFVIKTILYGLILLQAYLYYVTFKKDRLWLKLLIAFLVVADTVNIVFDVVYIYTALIIHFNDPAYLANANWLFATDPAINGITTATVQLFFAWRVKVLTGNIWLVSLITITSISSGLCAIGAAAATEWVPQFVNFQKFEVVVIIWLAGSAVSDVVITAAMTWYLVSISFRWRCSGALTAGSTAPTQIRIWVIRPMTIQTGFLQAVFAIIDLIFFLVDPSGTHLIFNWILSKLYSNAILSSLNSRSGWKFGSTDNGNLSAGLSSTRRGVSTLFVVTTHDLTANGNMFQQVVQVFRREEVELNVISDIKEDSYPSSGRNSDPV
ncbi:hypothetical protein PLEOSDRAFT_1108892 [Pleurotus ostreatus PC15]|uniref:DUF6534 domain-containing protein n=1 Tax=Pleurotus ostreatus (strain PC15) TaxID=1137138 RepID=A0A067NHK4_PLEO1|nr:hypothetical protein PLEOSDRAFT_1108892 [Pleurotus ostreatus PC15]